MGGIYGFIGWIGLVFLALWLCMKAVAIAVFVAVAGIALAFIVLIVPGLAFMQWLDRRKARREDSLSPSRSSWLPGTKPVPTGRLHVRS